MTLIAESTALRAGAAASFGFDAPFDELADALAFTGRSRFATFGGLAAFFAAFGAEALMAFDFRGADFWEDPFFLPAAR